MADKTRSTFEPGKDTLFMTHEETPAETKKIDYSAKNIYQKLAIARSMLVNQPLKKTGENKFNKFNYFELGDFLPEIVRISAEVGITSVFRIYPGEKSINSETGNIIDTDEIAELKIINADKPDEVVTFACKTVDAKMNGATDIQMLGAQHTYMRRYLWMEAFEITENDIVDANSGSDKAKAADKPTTADSTPATAKQISMIVQADPERVKNMLAFFKKKSVQELSVIEASRAIAQLNKPEGEQANA